MREHNEQVPNLEARLRRSSPLLRAADPTRVAAAWTRIALDGAQRPRRDYRSSVRPLIRIAAGLVLLLGVAGIFVRPQPRKHADSASSVPQVATFADLAQLMQEQTLAHTLAGEADDLTDDLANLTDALNTSTQAILF